jgi:signal transduction histidine kinase
VRGKLLWKLVAINIPIIGIIMLVVWMAIDFLAADYFTLLMKRYNIEPAETHQMFVDSVHRYLIEASLIALVIAVGLSFLLTRRVLRPLSDMAEVTRRIAAGDYAARVQVASKDEIGELGVAFNQMADSLERVDLLRKTMVANIAHELRTPLTNVRGYLEGLADEVVPPSKDTFVMLQKEILRLVRLVEDLQQLTKAEAAKAYLRREPVILPELVAEVLQFNAPQFAARNIAVETAFDLDGVVLRGDRDRLLQVLRNLVENAWQYTPDGGRFRISGSRVPEGVKLSFVNSGGMSESDACAIFERFYRADKSRSRERGGAGIGLSIVKELVEAHGGQVGAEADASEVRVWFTLPL